MNERLVQLAKQAEMMSFNGKDVDVKLMMEKFSELIIQECVTVCEGLADNAWGKGEVKNTEQCIEAIKEHFGVEE